MSHLHIENQSSEVLGRAMNKVATECRNTLWTHEKILCGLTDILITSELQTEAARWGGVDLKRGDGGKREKVKKTSKVAKK